jgi:hypothetical protein
VSWDVLRALWSDRDDRYRRRARGGRHLPLSGREEAVVRAFRRSEIDLLPAATQALALIDLVVWTPPTPFR